MDEFDHDLTSLSVLNGMIVAYVSYFQLSKLL